jgi:hypothetical protein
MEEIRWVLRVGRLALSSIKTLIQGVTLAEVPGKAPGRPCHFERETTHASARFANDLQTSGLGTQIGSNSPVTSRQPT